MRYIFLIVLISLSCKTTSKSSQVTESPKSQGVFQEVSKEITEESIRITLKNTSSVAQYVLDPMEKKIEKNVDGKWQSVSVLYCDCGGPPCPAPPADRQVEVNGTFRFSWDLMEEKCESNENVRTTLKSKVESGQYRVIYRHKSEGGGIEQSIAYFDVK